MDSNSNSTLRRRHNPLQTNSAEEEDRKTHTRGKFFSLKQTLSLVLGVAVLSYLHHILTRRPASLSESLGSIVHREVEGPLAPPKDYDCAIFWLRMPKTASTTIAQTFLRPLFRKGNFTNIDLGPNSCITHVGGCAPFWKGQMNMRKMGSMGNQRQINMERLGGMRQHFVPPFGRKVTTSVDEQSTNNQRCFPSKENQNMNRLTLCHEYDPTTSTLNFGHRAPIPNRKQPLPAIVQAHFDAGPRLTTHVGIDPSLFGWILPPNPMVFSTFRDPIERIFSSFHYGIQFGGGRPGSVGKCDLPGVGRGKVQERVKMWEAKVVKTREIATFQNNTAPYQDLLRQYLKTCECAADNAYVQFLDPDTKDVHVAIQNLEDYVIVGLQNEMGETLSRWVNITRRSCRSHKHFKQMEGVFADIFNSMTADGEVKKFRESKITLDEADEANEARRKLSVVQEIVKGDENKEDTESSGISLARPDFNSLDEDLKEMITRFTAGDQKVWERVLELYKAQREWGRQ